MSLSRSETAHRRCAPLLALAAAVLAMLASGPVGAQTTPPFEVVSASLDAIDDVYYLNARIDYGFSQGVREALQRGVALTLDVQIEVRRQRRWRPDKTIASLHQRYELRYYALTQRYLVRNENSGEQSSFATLTAAIRHLGRLEALPVLDAALLKPDQRYQVRVRSVADVLSLPGFLRMFSGFFNESRLSSEWYTWQLEP